MAAPSRRTLLASLLLALAATAPSGVMAQAAQAQAPYPSRPVKLVVPFPPGGGSDMQARLLADRLRQRWNQAVVVENIAGAGGGLAAANVARAKPDGYTILFATHPMLAVNPYVYKKLPYKVADFTPVVKLIETPLVLLVPAASPFHTIDDLIQAARRAPGTIHYGTGGIGTTQHLTAELLKQRAGIDLTLVPYKGNAQTTTALLANEIQMFFDGVPSATAQMKGGRVHGLAVSSRTRLAALPELPAIGETLPDFTSTLAYGLLVPAGTPASVAAALNRDVNEVLKEPQYVARMTSEGASIEGGTPEQFAEFLARERAQWGALTKRLDLQLD